MNIRPRIEKLEKTASIESDDAPRWAGGPPQPGTIEEWEAQLAEAEKHRAENYQNLKPEGADWMENPKTIAEYEYAYMLRDEDQRGHHATENETE